VLRYGHFSTMEDQRAAVTRRHAALVREWGGAPGWFAVTSVVLSILWFPFRLLLDHGDPLASIVAATGLNGAIWAAMLPAFAWLNKKALPRPANPAELPAPVNEAYRRRGALVGLGVGVPFYGGLLLFCLINGGLWPYPIIFGLVLAGIVIVAVTRLRRP
jgi:hypothetical protein